jgi:hypothetical protein
MIGAAAAARSTTITRFGLTGWFRLSLLAPHPNPAPARRRPGFPFGGRKVPLFRADEPGNCCIGPAAHGSRAFTPVRRAGSLRRARPRLQPALPLGGKPHRYSSAPFRSAIIIDARLSPGNAPITFSVMRRPARIFCNAPDTRPRDWTLIPRCSSTARKVHREILCD